MQNNNDTESYAICNKSNADEGMTEAHNFMKHTFKHPILWVVALLALFISSCSGDDDPNNGALNEDLFGTWYGTRYYINNGNVKYQYFTLELESDGSGSMTYDAPSYFSTAYFTWTVRSDKVVCHGTYANTDGDVKENFNLEFQINEDQLHPQSPYSAFILTKDNSILIDGDGNITMQPDEQLYALQSVWVITDGTVVVKFNPNDTYDEYVLTAPGADTYKEHNTGAYNFNALNKTLIINSTFWDVVTLTNESLVIKNGTRQLSYSIGSDADVPDGADLRQLLLAGKTWYNNKYQITFYDGNKIRYVELSDKKYGSWGHLDLSADGTFTVNGSVVTCNFSDVSWQAGNSGASNWFPGWTYGQPCTKKYIFETLLTSEVKVTLPNSEVIYLESLE